MTSTVIIDDEAHCVQRLRDMLAACCSEKIALIGTFASADEGIRGITELQPQLVFLDVQMPGKSGFDMLKSLHQINFRIIFTTAYEKYALQAFKFSALDYLLKPVDPVELFTAVNKASTANPRADETGKMEVLLHNLLQIHDQSKKISVPTTDGFIFLRVSDIIRCQANINYTTIFLKGKRKLMVAKTLKEFEEMLGQYNFFRVHNSHLVNLICIESYQKGKGGSLVMSDGAEIEVSVRRKDTLLKRLKQM
jgi:two-component system LytT family response regulator